MVAGASGRAEAVGTVHLNIAIDALDDAAGSEIGLELPLLAWLDRFEVLDAQKRKARAAVLLARLFIGYHHGKGWCCCCVQGQQHSRARYPPTGHFRLLLLHLQEVVPAQGCRP